MIYIALKHFLQGNTRGTNCAPLFIVLKLLLELYADFISLELDKNIFAKIKILSKTVDINRVLK
jgi:hypothetical protein